MNWQFEAENVLNDVFLIFMDFEARYSYKIQLQGTENWAEIQQ